MGHRLLLYIQPVYNYSTNKIEYAEILIRKYRGIEGVERILKFVRRTNSYDIFDLDVLKESLHILKSIPDLGYTVGVNLCSQSLEISGFSQRVINEIKNSEVSKDKIIIEINEYTNFSNKTVIENMDILCNYGIKLALDDFGTGNTNALSFINTKFYYIKIDKQFIDIDKNWTNKQFLLEHMKDICDTMNIKTIVEGIETKEQLDKIRKLGYSNVQGYIVTKPIYVYDYINEQNKKNI